MKPLTRKNTLGNWATLLLPIKQDDSIDYSELEHEIDVIICAGVNGIYSNGTAGEFHNITEDEFDKVSSLLAEKCEKANIPFQIGVSHMSPKISLERLKRVKSLHPGAVQVILPDWFPITDKEILSFLTKMAEEASPIGLVLYNPPHAKRRLLPETLNMIQKEIPELIGIKVAGGEETWYNEMQEVMDDISVFIPGHHLATGYSRGAHGAYSNVACISPSGAQKWYDMMKVDIEGALEVESRINHFMNIYIVPYITEEKYMNGAVDKLLAVVGGWSGMSSRLRWPYRWIPDEHAIKLRQIAKEIIPEMFY